MDLSRRQAKEADRVGGIELMLAWPASLGPAPTLAEDHEREATAAEKAEAERLVLPSCVSHGLVPVHVRVACVRRPTANGGGVAVHLAVTIIGRRWVHASTTRQPKVMYAASEPGR